MAAKYLPRFGGDQPAHGGVGQGCLRARNERVERGGVVAEGDDFAYWAARYDEDHRHTNNPRTAGNIGAAERFAAKGDQ
jgi:hypothetical protein